MSEKSIEEIAKGNSEALQKAMDELDVLGKSVKEEDSELDILAKSLEEELGTDLSKSGMPTDMDMSKAKDEGGSCSKEDCCKKDCFADCCKKDCCNHGEKCCYEAKGAEPDPMDKSQKDGYHEELVKASDAFASLEKSVNDIREGVAGELDSLKKSLAALLNLNIKQAKVIASLAKSRQEDTDLMVKSMTALGGKPLQPGTSLGIGAAVVIEELTKSVSEVSDLLLKAIQEKKIDSRYLSIFGTHKDVARLPDDVKKIIGL